MTIPDIKTQMTDRALGKINGAWYNKCVWHDEDGIFECQHGARIPMATVYEFSADQLGTWYAESHRG